MLTVHDRSFPGVCGLKKRNTCNTPDTFARLSKIKNIISNVLFLCCPPHVVNNERRGKRFSHIDVYCTRSHRVLPRHVFGSSSAQLICFWGHCLLFTYRRRWWWKCNRKQLSPASSRCGVAFWCGASFFLNYFSKLFGCLMQYFTPVFFTFTFHRLLTTLFHKPNQCTHHAYGTEAALYTCRHVLVSVER